MPATEKAKTKAEIVAHFAEKLQVTRKVAGEFLQELCDLAVSETKRAGEFAIPGLGKLKKSTRQARTGRNPATGETIAIPAKTVVKMRLAKAFQDAIVEK